MGAVGDAGMWTSCENEQLCRCSAKYVNTEIKSNEPTFIVIILEICFMAFLWWCVTSTKLLWWVVIKLKVIHYFNAGTEWQNTMDFYWKRRQRFANAAIFFVMHLGIKISMFTFFFAVHLVDRGVILGRMFESKMRHPYTCLSCPLYKKITFYISIYVIQSIKVNSLLRKIKSDGYILMNIDRQTA